AAARATPARARAVAAFEAAGAPLSAREVAEAAGVGTGVVRGLAGAGVLTSVEIDPDPPFPAPAPDAAAPTLSSAQRAAADKLIAAVEAGAGTTLLDGVTGAGKTEVYLEAVAEALRRDPDAQALVLLPEIALTLPFLERVKARFAAEPAAWHSELGLAARRRVWRRVLDGGARIVVGARSALFLPFRNLKIVVVDEEHEAAYKQEDGLIYQGRDLAVARGARGGFPVILASATPSLETVVNVDRGRYGLARIAARFGGAQLPDVELVDLRKERLGSPSADKPDERRGEWLAPRLVDAVDEALAAGRQAMLFLNRRGYAPLTLCRRCGHRMKAPDSDTWLVEHRYENKLVCHHTGFSMPKPAACPECKAPGGLTACGPGVERVAEEAARLWPDARRAVLSSDQAQGAGVGPGAARSGLNAMAAGEVDLLVATQMAAKGHHFPGLAVVGVVDADMGLMGGALRAAERTYQLLSQVAGRAGRAAGAQGRALLQTHQPEAPVLQALRDNDRDAFLAAEAAGREAQGFPPYGRLAAIILRSKNEKALGDVARAHGAALFAAKGIVVWGPAPAPLYRLRGEMRLRFLVKARRDVDLQGFLSAWLGRVRPSGPVRRTVDIDPYTFL
ncbi:MAG: primosomal protein N', partial [Parvularculaceae bacterium]